MNNLEKRIYFKKAYEQYFGEFPAKDDMDLKFWYEVIDRIPDYKLKSILEYMELNISDIKKPRIKDLKAAINAINSDKKYIEDEPDWRIEAACKLGIPVSQLPHHADYLTDTQRRILDIPSKAERKQLFAELYANLNRVKTFNIPKRKESTLELAEAEA